jgi:predicted  nucleic acid-binding Zn-ribbon protein
MEAFDAENHHYKNTEGAKKTGNTITGLSWCPLCLWVNHLGNNMAGIGDTFREIHRLRKHARDLQQEIDRGPVQLKARRNVAAKAAEGTKDANEGLKKVKVGIHEKEVSLKAIHAQIAKYEKQLDDVKDKKQFDALKHEIAAAKEKGRVIEDQILESMSEIEERAAKLPEHEKVTAKAKEDLATFERELGERLTRQAELLKTALAQLKTIEQQIPEQFVAQYQRMINAFGADSLAAVENHSCQHCHTHITVQQLHEVDTGEFVTCRSCGRGLYVAAA